MSTQLLNVPAHVAIVNQKLMVVGGGTTTFTDLPVKPFEIIETTQPGENDELIHVIGENRDTYIHKVEYDRIPMMSFNKDHKVEERPKFDYLLSLFREYPEAIPSLTPAGVTPFPLFIDIETTGFNPIHNEILSVQIDFLDTDPGDDIFIAQVNGMNEKDVLLEMIKVLSTQRNGLLADFIVSFNGVTFDIPFIMKRLEKHQLLGTWREAMNKTDGDLFNCFWLSDKDERNIYEPAKGLQSYDLYLMAKNDLKLSKLPSRNQKAVAQFYGMDDVYDLPTSEKRRMKELLENDPERFERYARSDTKQLRFLYNIYSMRTMAEANLLGVPFIVAHRMSSGQKSFLPLYRTARKAGYYGLSTNIERYRDLYSKGKYQGAIVGSWAHGYYDKIIYVDAKSMYPGIMTDLNLSPDRYKLLEIMNFEKTGIPDEWRYIKTEGPPTSKIVYIPDKNYNVVFKFQVDVVNDGYMRSLIKYYNGIRDEYKREMKKYAKSDKPEDKFNTLKYDSMQMAAKVINNTYYGINGNQYYSIGDLPQAIFVTAIGRWLMMELIDYFGGSPDYPKTNGTYADIVLECDTDGILIDRTNLRLTIDDINKHMRDRIHEVFGVPHEKMTFEMEYEGAGSIYLYKMKNYILKTDEEPDKLTIKGSAFTGYDKAPIIKRAVEIMASCVMFKKIDYSDAVEQCRDMNAPLEMFKFSKTIKKDPTEYKGFANLINQMKYVNETYGTKKYITSMKKVAKDWIESRFKNKEDVERGYKGDHERLKKSLHSLIKDSETVDELLLVAEFIQDVVGGSNSAANYFLLDLIQQYREKNIFLKEDDTLEYYMTNSKSGYNIADDITDKSQLDIDRYLLEINRIIERFEYANSELQELSLW